jgi:hypothetical protein
VRDRLANGRPGTRKPDPVIPRSATVTKHSLRESEILPVIMLRSELRSEQSPKNVVGTGILAFADALKAGGFDEYDDEFNDPSDDSYERWSEEQECDVVGRDLWAPPLNDFGLNVTLINAVRLRCLPLSNL